MGKGDNRLTPKTRQRKNQKKKKLALQAKIDEAKSAKKTKKKGEVKGG
jgi:hypothetical protein